MKQTTPHFTIDSKMIRENPLIAELRLRGRFDAEGLPLVLTEIEDVRAAGCTRFLIDLEEIDFIGSAGIGIFLSLVEEMQTDGGGVAFLSVPASVRRILDVLNVREFLEIVGDRNEALHHLLHGEGQPSA
ncbi:MAG: STAS domain-containing protein [Candidatus Eisenbacteria bacterium]